MLLKSPVNSFQSTDFLPYFHSRSRSFSSSISGISRVSLVRSVVQFSRFRVPLLQRPQQPLCSIPRLSFAFLRFPRNFFIISHHHSLVKYFFKNFSSIFSSALSCPPWVSFYILLHYGLFVNSFFQNRRNIHTVRLLLRRLLCKLFKSSSLKNSSLSGFAIMYPPFRQLFLPLSAPHRYPRRGKAVSSR